MRRPTTISTPLRAAIGIQATKAPSKSATTSVMTPAMMPEIRVSPPLDRLTMLAPIVPAPGMPPMVEATTLASPCAASSRLGSWRVRVI